MAPSSVSGIPFSFRQSPFANETGSRDPGAWPEYLVHRQFYGANYHITVRNPNGIQEGVKQGTLDGALIEGTVVPPH